MREALVVFALCAVLVALGTTRRVGVYDEGLILNGAMRVANGDVPHRDFYANYGPAQFYVLAPLFKLFGPSVLIERLWDTLVRATTAAIVYALVRRSGRRAEAAIATALVLIWLVALDCASCPIFPALLCALAGALCLLPVFEGRTSGKWPFAAGLFAGVATLFRYDVGFYVVAAEGIVVLAHGLFRQGARGPRLSRTVSDLAFLASGLALLCVPVAVAYVATGAAGDFAFDVLVYPTTLYRRMRSLPFPGPVHLLADPIDLAIYLPPLIWVTAGGILLSVRETPARPPRLWLVGLLALMSALFYIKGLVRVSVIQIALSLLPALIVAVLVSPIIRSARSRLLRIWSTTIGIVFVLPPTVVAAAVGVADIADGIRWAAASTTWAPASADVPARLGPCHPRAHLGRMACFALPDPRAAAIQYVAARSRPDERIFVGTGRHDVVYANDNLFYFLAGRRPATKWSHYDPGLQTSADVQREMIAELRKTKPRFVVLVREFDNLPPEPNESGRGSGVTLLDDFLRTTYRTVQTFGSTSVLEPKT